MEMKNIPKKIYLQVDEIGVFNDATWSEDKINDNDIEYVESDLYNEMLEYLIDYLQYAKESKNISIVHHYVSMIKIIEKATGLKIEEVLK